MYVQKGWSVTFAFRTIRYGPLNALIRPRVLCQSYNKQCHCTPSINFVNVLARKSFALFFPFELEYNLL